MPGIALKRSRFPAVVFSALVLAVAGVCFGQAKTSATSTSRALATEILSVSKIKTGFGIHLGCGGGTVTLALSRQSSLLIQGLSIDPGEVAKARQHIQADGRYGRVTVRECSFKKLPYADGMANLIVVDGLPALLSRGASFEEMARVLCPGGVVIFRQLDSASKASFQANLKKSGMAAYPAEVSDGWLRIQKPVPGDTDEWTHYRHGPDGNMVSLDRRIQPSKQIRWMAKPSWQEHHKGPMGAVSTDGKIFYALDETPLAINLPRRLYLTARDAYNGTEVWRKPIFTTVNVYETRIYKELIRLSLVAVDKRVYTRLEPEEPLVALDADSGEIIKRYPSFSPDQVIVCQDVLYGIQEGSIKAISRESGKTIWEYKGKALSTHKKPGRRTMQKWRVHYFVIGDGKIMFQEEPALVSCLDMTTGKKLWETATKTWLPSWTEAFEVRDDIPGQNGEIRLALYYQKSVVLGGKGGVHALSAEDGRHLWSYQYSIATKINFTEAHGMNGLVWVRKGGHYNEKFSEAWIGLDPATGKETKRIDYPPIVYYPIKKARCYPDKVVGRFFLVRSLQFLDSESGKFHNSYIARGSCEYGHLPANGLIYTFAQICKCYSMMRAVAALSGGESTGRDIADLAKGESLRKGPAYGMTLQDAGTPKKDEWPTFRYDFRRSGATPAAVPTELSPLWTKAVAPGLTTSVVADGMVFVASSETHALYALDAKNGNLRWTYQTDGGIDFPPTVYRGLCLLGARDGRVYCLKADDGSLVWSLRAAPNDRQIVVFGRVESIWPVGGERPCQ